MLLGVPGVPEVPGSRRFLGFRGSEGSGGPEASGGPGPPGFRIPGFRIPKLPEVPGSEFAPRSPPRQYPSCTTWDNSS